MNPSLGELSRYFLHLGATCFGGFGTQAAQISKDLVETRGWVSRGEFLRGVAFSSLCPGPVGPQLVVYIGRIKAGWRGAAACAVAFVLPAFALTLTLAALYVRLGTVAPFQGFLHGVSASVIAVLVLSLRHLSRLTLGARPLLWTLALLAAAALLAGFGGTTSLILLSGLAALAFERPPARAGAASPGLLALFVFFFKAGAFVFGTGLAILSVLRQDLVGRLGWVSEREFLDALAVGLVTPGPIVMAGAFIGYLAAGLPGAAVAALGLFLPVFLISATFAPSVERGVDRPALKAFVAGATAAATGAILAATVHLSRAALAELPAMALAAGSLAVLAKTKVPAPLVLLACGLIGLALRP